ncbi:MAG: PorT family protein [Tannerella sp.]|jgi:hypothetical protein|nr:PorT family protein [Tannerella sp.]
MLRKVLVVIAVAILTVGSAQAQFKFGVRAGFNLTNLSFDQESGSLIRSDTKFKPGFQIGAVGDYSFGESFAIQPALVFATQGCAIKDSGETENLYYLQLPINAQYKLDLGKMKLLLQAGPYLGYGLGGKYEGEDITMGGGDDADYKALDFGVGVGAGLQFGNIQAALGYNIGIIDIDPSEYYSAKNSGLALTLTYLFGK